MMRVIKNILELFKELIEGIIFHSRWILVPFYLGLVIAQVFYCWKFGIELIELCHNFRALKEADFMLAVLTLIDITMIANLIKMIIAGSYQSFVNKIPNDHSEKISSGYLKVKMGTSLIGVSSIHLLQTFINSKDLTDRDLYVKCGIHGLFVVSTLVLAWIDLIHCKINILHENAH